MIETVQKSSGGFQRLIDEGVFSRDGDRASDGDADNDSDSQGDEPVPMPPSVPEPTTDEQPAAPAPETVTTAAQPAVEVEQPVPEADPVAPPPAPADNSSSTEEAAPRTQTFDRICRECSHELFLASLYDWWARQRVRIIAAAPSTLPSGDGEQPLVRSLPDWVMDANRKDCQDGRGCPNQHAPSHAKECEHPSTRCTTAEFSCPIFQSTILF